VGAPPRRARLRRADHQLRRRGFSTRIAAEVRNVDALPPPPDRKLLKFGNRSHRFALVAAEEAMRDAGVAPTPADRHRWAAWSAPA